jgi:hypothetical protein
MPQQRHYLTWMPTSVYSKNALCFVTKDLMIVRNAILRCLRYLNNNTMRRRNIRAAEIWRDNIQSLRQYGIIIALECRRRGIADTSLDEFRSGYIAGIHDKPTWVYWDALNESHRNYLVLREYRRLAKTLVSTNRNTIQRRSLPATYSRLHLPPLTEWTYTTVRYIFNGCSTQIPPNKYVVSDGWVNNPVENIQYPGRVY